MPTYDALTALAAELMARRPSLSPELAYRLAAETDPALYSLHGALEGNLGTIEQEPAQAGSAAGGLPAAGQRHFYELSAAERAREPLMRRLRPGELLGDRTGVAKMATPDAGGGMFVIESGR